MGALMISLDCHHPDLEEFLEIKSDLDRVTKANISVRITNDFMRAVKDGKNFTLSFTRPESGEVIEKDIDARAFFMKLAKMNWDYAEPGCLFWDRIENYNLMSEVDEFHYSGTNPCAEEPLPAGGSCLLGSINLSEFVKPDKLFDFNGFEKTVNVAVRALNDVLDEGLPLHPLQEQRDSVRDWRQIGLGIMGLADMLIKMGIEYGSDKSLQICDTIGTIMATAAINASIQLAKSKGAFPKCDNDKIEKSKFYQEHMAKPIPESGLYNSQLLTIAPTGTLSTMLGISGGIEPIFANSYERKTESLHGEDVYYKVYTPIVDRYMKEHGLTEEIELPNYFVTAQNLDYRKRIAMQATWQKHIDASISSTVNVPNDFSVDQVFDLYMLAWKSGLKGVTIYRDGCKRSGVLSTTERNTAEDSEANTLKRGDVISTSDGLIGLKRRLMTGCGTLHCSAFFDPVTGDLMETYLSKGSTGGCLNTLTAMSRLISLSARAGLSIEQIVDQLNSCGVCPSYAVRTATKHDTSKGSCCPIAVGNALLDMHDQIMRNVINYDPNDAIDEHDDQVEQPAEDDSGRPDNVAACPECGEPLIFEGGCNICKSCGWSRCS